MTDLTVTYQCPSCGGALRFDANAGTLKCDFCDGAFSPAEIEELLKAKNEAAAAAMENASNSPDDWGSGSEGMKTYICPSCGAELICDANTAASSCPYCGNQTVVPGQFSGVLRPEYIIPFKTDKNAATEALKKHYKGKFLLPRSFASGNHIEEIQGVYVPFWLFDCTTSGQVTFDARNISVARVGNEEITTTRHYQAIREGSLDFEKVPVDASSRMPHTHMDSIEPFDYGDLRGFSMAYMPGFLADKYDVESESCAGRMAEKCEKTFISEADKTVVGYDEKNMRSKSVRVEKSTAHYAMLPVWLLATKWREKNFLFAMNGQTGKLVGDLPVHWGKFWGLFFAIFGGLTGAAMLIDFLAIKNPETELIIFSIVIPLVIALIVCLVMFFKMRSVRTGDAGAYKTEAGLNLTVSQDLFIRTSVTTRKINND